MTTDTNLNENIVKAIQYLAGVCDYANKKDDAGFNAFDAGFGHSLAEQSAAGVELSSGALAAAHKMVYKYRGQLESVGIVLPKPTSDTVYKTSTSVATPTNPVVTLNNLVIEIRFGGKPSEQIRNAIKSMKPWRWAADVDGKPWQVPARYASQVIALLPGAQVSDEVKALAVGAPQTPSIPTNPTPEPENLPDVVITRENGTILVSFPNPDGRIDRVVQVKSLPERKWKPDLPGKPWQVPSRLASDVVAMFPDAEIDQGTKDLLAVHQELSELSTKTDSEIEIGDFGIEPYPFQKAGVEFIERAKGRAIVGDQMGLGKTIQALAYLNMHPELRPAVIVCPASLKTNWVRETERCLRTSDRIAVLEGQKTFDPAITGASIFVINWDILSYWKETLINLNPAVIVADEAHYAKNSKSKRSKAISAIAKKIERVILLTGTPVTNRPVELFPLLNMVNPAAWPSFYRYAHLYCGAKHNGFGWDFNGASNLDELHQKIAPYMIRRTKDQVLTELPAKARRTIVVRFDEQYRAEYDAKIDKALSMAESKGRAQALVFIEAAKQITVKAKLEATVEWLDNFIESNGKLVVFATHHSTIDYLTERYGAIAVKVDGRVSQDERQNAVDKFQNDPNVRLFIGNIKAAGVGITLTAASDVIFLEFPWTPGDADQAEDRCHRIGQDDQVTAYYLVAENSIDETIVRLLESKRNVIDTIHDGKPGELDFSILGELLEQIKKEK